MDSGKIYPRTGDAQTVYIKSVCTGKNVEIGEYSMYNDFVRDPRDFEKNNILYHYPVNGDRLVMGRYCSVACGAKFIFTSANHTMKSLSTYPFPIFFEEWGLDVKDIKSAWDNKGDIIIGNDVWIGYEAVILSGVTIGDGAIIGARAVVTKDVPPYTIVGGVPAKPIRRRFPDETIAALEGIKWWDRPAEWVRAHIPAIQSGDIAALAASPALQTPKLAPDHTDSSTENCAGDVTATPVLRTSKLTPDHEDSTIENCAGDVTATSVLRTPRLTLEPLSLDHADSLFENCLSDELTAARVSWSAHKTAEEARGTVAGWFEYADAHPGYVCWTIFYEGKAIGTILINDGELGYNLGSRFWGKGLATEAARAVLEYAFFGLGMEEMLATHAPDNAASQKVLIKLGFEDAGMSGSLALRRLTREDWALREFTSTSAEPATAIPEIEGDGLLLRLENVSDNGAMEYGIYEGDTRVGRLALRPFRTRAAFYTGNIGYAVYPPYRGRHIAARACRLAAEVLKSAGLWRAIIVCDAENAPSRAVCSQLNAAPIALRTPPKDSCAAANGFKNIAIYAWDFSR